MRQNHAALNSPKSKSFRLKKTWQATMCKSVFVLVLPARDKIFMPTMPPSFNSLAQLDSLNHRIRIFNLCRTKSAMYSVLDTLDDFVLFAHHSPSRATLFAFLILILLFTPVWTTWITRLQQIDPMNLSSVQTPRTKTQMANRAGAKAISCPYPPRKTVSASTSPTGSGGQQENMMINETPTASPGSSSTSSWASPNHFTGPNRLRRRLGGFSSVTSLISEQPGDQSAQTSQPFVRTSQSSSSSRQSTLVNSTGAEFSDPEWGYNSEDDDNTEFEGDVALTYNRPGGVGMPVNSRRVPRRGCVSFYPTTSANGRGKLIVLKFLSW